MSNKVSIDSMCVKELKNDAHFGSHQLPIYATSSFEFETMQDGIDIFTGQKEGFIYSRYGNPTINVVAQKIADLEAYNTGLEAYGFLTSSGMSAISTVLLSLVHAGDAILTQTDLYGGTSELMNKVLSKNNIASHYIDLTQEDQVEATLKQHRNIRVVYIETPANPTMKCIDLAVMSKIAKKYGVITVVDNTFCTPIIQQPLALGIDFVIHSTTKYLNGHGNSISGVIIGHLDQYKKEIWTTLKLVGSTCNAWDAWLINNGLKTLPLRMKAHSQNAMQVAKFLEAHPKVTTVNYNGLATHAYHTIAAKQMNLFGGMLSFTIDGDLNRTLQIIDKMKFCSMAPTLGDVDTLVLHPATSSHLAIERSVREKAGITDNLIRLSIGIESAQDIIDDLDQAMF